MRGLFTNALGVIDRKLKSAPDDPTWLFGKGFASIQTQRLRCRHRRLEPLLDIQTNNDDALFNRASPISKATSLDAARADYLRLQQTFTNSFQVAYGLGEIAWRQHDTNEAIRNYQIYLANANTNTAEATNLISG